MKFEIISKVYIPTIGNLKNTHIQEFSEDSNVFERALEYRKYMYKQFPNCDFELISAKQIKGE